MRTLLVTIAVAFGITIPIGSVARAETGHVELLAQHREATKGNRQRMRGQVHRNQGSRRVNKPIHTGPSVRRGPNHGRPPQAQRNHGSRRVNKPIYSGPSVRRGPNHGRPPQAQRNHGRQRIGPPPPRFNGQRRHSSRPHIRPSPRAHQRHPRRGHRHRHWHSWRGHVVATLPSHRHRHYHHGTPYFFFDNLWYRSHSAGFIVVTPPFGLVVPFLPSTYERVVIEDRTYLHSNGIYYSRVDDGYTIVRSPTSEQDLDSFPDMPLLTVAPLEQQSETQTAQDKTDCHLRAVDQSGFDPRIEGGGVSYASYLERKHTYRQVFTECLSKRDYEVS